MYNKRSQLYLQQRGFAFAATRAYKATYNDALETNDLLRALGGYRCSLYSAQYASFIHEYKLDRSLKSLKLFFLEIEAGIYENTLPQDEDTVAMAIDRIVWKEEENKRGRKENNNLHANIKDVTRKLHFFQHHHSSSSQHIYPQT